MNNQLVQMGQHYINIRISFRWTKWIGYWHNFIGQGVIDGHQEFKDVIHSRFYRLNEFVQQFR